jgi:hypothetical protein
VDEDSPARRALHLCQRGCRRVEGVRPADVGSDRPSGRKLSKTGQLLSVRRDVDNRHLDAALLGRKAGSGADEPAARPARRRERALPCLFAQPTAEWSALGTFSLYSNAPDAFSEEDHEFASILAA